MFKPTLCIKDGEIELSENFSISDDGDWMICIIPATFNTERLKSEVHICSLVESKWVPKESLYCEIVPKKVSLISICENSKLALVESVNLTTIFVFCEKTNKWGLLIR